MNTGVCRVSMLGLLGVILLACTAASVCLADATSDFQAAKALFESEDWTGAVARYNQLLTDYPDSEEAGQAYYWIGQCYEKLRNIDQAIASYQSQLAQYPQSKLIPATLLKLGEKYFDRRQYDQAIQELEKVPSTAGALAVRAQFRIGQCYEGMYDFDNALAAFRGVAANYPGTSEANESLLKEAEYLRMQDKYAEEAAYLEGLYNNHPALRVEALFWWAHALERQGKVDEAVQKLVQMKSEYPEQSLRADLWTGTYYQSQKRYPEAIAVFQAAIASAPASVSRDDFNLKQMKYRLGACYRESDQWDTALEYVQRLLEEYPEDATQHKNDIARCHQALNNEDTAQAIRGELIAEDPDSREARDTLLREAVNLEVQKRYDEALAYVDQLLSQELTPGTRAEALFLKCDYLSVYFRDFNGAIATLEQLISELPDDPLAVDARGRIARLTLTGLKQPARARELFNQVIAAYPDHQSIIEWKYYQAFCSYAGEDWATARAGFQAILDKHAVSEYIEGEYLPPIKYSIAECSVHLGDYAAARKIYEELVAKFPGTGWARESARKLESLSGK